MSWRHAVAIVELRDAVNKRWPNRNKASDGTIGDAAHASRNSDHNPWIKDGHGIGVVRAVDITAGGIDPNWYAEYLRGLGMAGDPRLNGGGYVIWNRQIASERQNWAWRPYSGSNPHTKHIHLSLSRDAAGYDSPRRWTLHNTPTKDWFDMATKAELREVVDEALADALGPKSKLDVSSKVRSIFRHTVEGDGGKDESTVPNRVLASLQTIQKAVTKN